MKRVPKLGDVVMLEPTTKLWLVVGWHKEVSAVVLIPEDRIGTQDPKCKTLEVSVGSPAVPINPKTQIHLNDIFLVDHIKIKVQTQVTYQRK